MSTILQDQPTTNLGVRGSNPLERTIFFYNTLIFIGYFKVYYKLKTNCEIFRAYKLTTSQIKSYLLV